MRAFTLSLVRYRFLYFLFSLALIGIAAVGLKDLRYTADYRIFFAPDDPNLRAFEDMQDRFSRADNIMFVLAPKNKDLFTEEGIRATQWLTGQAWQLLYSLRVDSIVNYDYTEAQGDDLNVHDLLSGVDTLDKNSLRSLKALVMNEPTLQRALISTRGDVTAININLNFPENKTEALHALMAQVDETVATFHQQFPGVDIHVLGLAPFNFALEDVAKKDFALLLPIMFIVILSLIGFMTRSFANSVVTSVIVITSVVTTIGWVGWWDVMLNNINSVAPIVIMTLAIADSVHILSVYSRHLREGMSKTDAMTISLEENLRPVFLTFFTVVVGFLGLNTIDSPPFREFGNIASVGISMAFVFSFTLLPQLAMWLSRTGEQKIDKNEGRVLLAIADFVIQRPKKIFFTTLSVSLMIGAFIGVIDLNDDNIRYFSEKVTLRQSVEFTQANLTGANYIEYVLNSGAEEGITSINFLQKVDAFATWYRSQPEVKHVATFTDTLKQLNKNMHGDDPSWYVLPDNQQLASQYLLLYEMSLPVGRDLNNQIDIKKSRLRMTVRIDLMKARQNLALEQRAQVWLATHAPEIQSPGTSPTIMFSHIGQKNIDSMMFGTLSSIFIICLTLFLGIGSLRLGAISILPNVFPGVIMLGLWGIFVGEVNMGVAAVFTITTGIVVDDTIHLFTYYSEAIKRGLSIEDAIRQTFKSAGRSVITTTVVLVSGFSVLIFSNFMVNVTMGIMVAGTIAIAVIFDLLFLPAVLMLFGGKKDSQKSEKGVNYNTAVEGSAVS